jgi:hypothetical protein
MSTGDIHEGLGNIHSGVIQQDVNAVNAGESGVHLLTFGYVANNYARPASGIGNAFCDLFEFAAGPADQDHLGASSSESKRPFGADAAACASDQRDAAVESKSWRDCSTFGRGRRGVYRVSPELFVTLTLRLP